MSRSLRIVFAGTPEFARAHLLSLINSQHEIVSVYTQPDRPSGRGRKQTASPVKSLALQHDIPVCQPESLKSPDAEKTLASFAPDLMIVVAYGLILPRNILSIPTHGCINVHASLLPAWRGAAPVQRAIMAGDAETGVTIMQMDTGLDTGDILHQVNVPIEEGDTSAILLEKLAESGGVALNIVLEQIENGHLSPRKQNEADATYAHKIRKEEGCIQWKRSAREISCFIHGMNPWPVAWTTIEGTVMRCWEATPSTEPAISAKPGTLLRADRAGLLVACKDHQALLITKIQLPGKRAMPVHEVLNSRKTQFLAGTIFQ